MARSFKMPKASDRKLGVPGAIFAFFGTIALAIVFVAAGFGICLIPQVTHTLADVYAKDDVSPLPKESLVAVADATRTYSFIDHDRGKLLQVIYEQDLAYERALAEQGEVPGEGFPDTETLVGKADVVQLQAVFEGASEQYAYSPATIAHLDDCYAIARYAYPIIAGIAVLAVAACVFAGVRGGKYKLGNVLLGAGAIVLVAFAGLGVWAVLDFDGFFTAFHSVLFSQGNWTFPDDSLLICALPTAFWTGMGAVWLAVTATVSILSIAIGVGLRRRSR